MIFFWVMWCIIYQLFWFSGNYHHPACTEIETLQAQMEQMSGPGTCGPPAPNSNFAQTGTGTGRSSNRSRRGSSRTTAAADAIDIIDPGYHFIITLRPPITPMGPSFHFHLIS